MFKQIKRALAAFFTCLMIVACTAVIEDYRDTKPNFELFEYFNGKSIAWGMIQDYTKFLSKYLPSQTS